MRYVIIIFVIIFFSSCEKENIIDQLVGFYTVSGYQLSCSFNDCGDTLRIVDDIQLRFYKSFRDGNYSDKEISLEVSYNDDFYFSSSFFFKEINKKKYIFKLGTEHGYSNAIFEDNKVDLSLFRNGDRINDDSSVYTYLNGYKIE